MEFGQLRRTRHGYAESAPYLCENGHELGGNEVIVGYLPCRCSRRGGHRTWRCHTCSSVIYAPELGPDCRPLNGAG